MDNPHDVFDVMFSDGAPSKSEGDTILGDHVRDRPVEPITETLARQRHILSLNAQLSTARWVLDDPGLLTDE